MAHRTQITLSDAQYAFLKRESERTGLGLAELVRRALDRHYCPAKGKEAEAALDQSFGAWRHLVIDGEAYVEGLRRGIAKRLPQ